MNARKLAEALRLAAEALEEDEPEEPAVRLNGRGEVTAVARPRPPRTFPAPLGEVSEVDAAQKVRARYVVNLAVKTGRMPRPNSLPCVDCGHVWVPGERRHEYDHHRGYSQARMLDVVAVCTTCHARRSNAQEFCRAGLHKRTLAMVMITPQGYRVCRGCRRLREAKRRAA